MLSARISFDSLKEKTEYINKCEKSFDFEISDAVQKLLNHKKLKFVYVCGPSCSGKTTASDMLISKLSEKGRKVEIISVDDYYKNRETIISECQKKGVPVDFESLSAIDFPLFKRTLSDFSISRPELEIPIFNFKNGIRCGTRTIKNTEETLILFEGIQTVYPEISALLNEYETEGVRIGVFDNVCVGDSTLSMTDIRLVRRIVRDVFKRNTSPLETLKLWDSVRSNEIKNIEPYINKINIKINSFLGYEISAMRNRAIKLLETIPEESPYKAISQRLYETIYPCEETHNSLIPKNSIIREFLI